MIFTLKEKKDKLTEMVYKKSMIELSKFYGLNWIKNRPSIIFVDTRKEINKLKSRKTEKWVIGWSERNKIFLLNPKKYKKESNHKYFRKEFIALIKHELSHSFFSMKTRRASYKPLWLNEGIAIFVSGQNKFKKKPEKFERVLSFYEEGGEGIYKESGFLIELLLNKFGKAKLIKLIEDLEKINSRKEFEKLFKRIYGFELNYEKINKIK
ncbi:MAG: hypothetical protein Q8P15_01050 [Nanoarchaeota archaeon]|nr:hypothetical protein [Nanoarchaeota archaeon]